ncbi:MAG: DUF1573 domain-containing protein [Candidatus Kapabacteria bacterium]|nr:DUF1573 domain-containing protein [Candidatus Kapabacteria bacterium]
MNKLIISLIVLIAFFVVDCNADQKIEVKGPKLEIIGGDTYDWGKVKPKDSPLKSKIKIINTGTEKLIIQNVKPGCGCTTAPLDKSDLMPGDTATLDVKLNIGDHPGMLSKSITITSNDPNNTTKILSLKADVVKPFTFEPAQYFSFDKMKVGFESMAKITIKNISNEDITFSDFSATPEEVRISKGLKKVLRPNETYDLEIKVRPSKTGYYNCSVKMKTNLADYPEVTLTGYGTVSDAPIFNEEK